MSTALVTVVMPVYNAMPYLPAAVDSLFTQSLTDIDFLFIDDSSSDDSGEYLDNLRHPNLTVIHQSHKGVSAARSLALKLCETPFLALMDADDISLPGRLSAQIDYLESHPECVVVGAQIDFLIGNTKQRGLPCATRHEEIAPQLMRGGGIVYPTVVFRTEVARRIGGFRLNGAGEEYDFCVRMSECGAFANLPEALYQYRLHNSSISMMKQTELRRGAAYARTTAIQRRNGQSETSFEEFRQMWEKRPMTEVLRERIKVTSNLSYRRARVNLAEGRRALGYVQMALSAGLDPPVALAHLRRIVSSKLPSFRASPELILEELNRNYSEEKLEHENRKEAFTKVSDDKIPASHAAVQDNQYEA